MRDRPKEVSRKGKRSGEREREKIEEKSTYLILWCNEIVLPLLTVCNNETLRGTRSRDGSLHQSEEI
jgi:hypothetical protein